MKMKDPKIHFQPKNDAREEIRMYGGRIDNSLGVSIKTCHRIKLFEEQSHTP